MHWTLVGPSDPTMIYMPLFEILTTFYTCCHFLSMNVFINKILSFYKPMITSKVFCTNRRHREWCLSFCAEKDDKFRCMRTPSIDWVHSQIFQTMAVYMEGFPAGFWSDIKIGSCIFQCDVPLIWMAQQVGSVCIYCDGVGCHVLCLQHGIPVWQHISQSTSARSRHSRDMTSDLKSNIKSKQTLADEIVVLYLVMCKDQCEHGWQNWSF